MFDKKLLLQHINNQDLSESRDHTIQGKNESDENYRERMARRSRNERHSSDVQIDLTNAARRRRGMPDLPPEKIKGTVQNKQEFGMRTAAKQYADRFGPDGTFVSNYSSTPAPTPAPEEVKQKEEDSENKTGFTVDQVGSEAQRKRYFSYGAARPAPMQEQSKPGAIKKKVKGIKSARANAGLIGSAMKGLMTPGYQDPDTPPPARSSGGY